MFDTLKRFVSCSLQLGALLTVSAPSFANLIVYGLATQDDGLITLDSQTGLEWLDLTATGNRSFSEVLGATVPLRPRMGSDLPRGKM